MIHRALMLIYAGIAYILALVNIAYLLGFFLDYGVPKGISDGEPATIWVAVLIDTSLVFLFGLHHSITARASFKRWWTKIIPAPIERATYLYMTAIMTVVLVYFWRPIPIVVWETTVPWLTLSAYLLFFAIVLMMIMATFQFGHFSFFGLAQAWQNFRKSSPAPLNMTARYLYAVVRHPISLGWMLLPLISPVVTAGHLVFALATFVYIMMATPFEERDLIEELGEDYLSYRRKVPAFMPFLKVKPDTATNFTSRIEKNDH